MIGLGSDKNDHFPEARSEPLARPCRPKAGFGLVVIMMVIVMILMTMIGQMIIKAVMMNITTRQCAAVSTAEVVMAAPPQKCK